jgi:hypothetical protein
VIGEGSDGDVVGLHWIGVLVGKHGESGGHDPRSQNRDLGHPDRR